ncbi:coproporphyrinogen III oxidase [Emiliania huxleyi CCMP1516]|uniref:Radical S-adenosyl methionine domain-containing protein 1, mitochondrial n=2 Tax=Emiliania huxleyi TaxID=2903 RepID=A0A0D3J662_EMIH1|nr:coproporphyrinogen III oxidase [Emiliania huxleyi CCMP1516]EOD18997.1 coproporphyrinogen III oxidase [Emiliania huxleyi CCMP1516]|eukprot:XP_005771426.1 coproporphyrinogen III oxidase [Emiliania huxleyi CCMP1516]
MPPATPRAAYVHLPFCRRRCFYCDFPISVVGSKPGAADAAAERYCALLHREIAASPSRQPGAPPLASLYFGGGTPSLTPPPLLAGLVDGLRDAYGLADGCEVTLEMDPGTFDVARLRAFLEAGVTRVSLGVQSFDDKLLTSAGRSHDAAEARAAVEILMQAQSSAGGLPGEDLASWRRSLNAAATTGAQHISVYDLQVEPRTAYGRWAEAGTLKALPDEALAAEMYREASAVLRARAAAAGRGQRAHGLQRYEVSSFGREGHRSQHNSAYWRNEPFFAFGLGATSHLDGVRLARPRRMDAYEAFAELGVREEGVEAMTTLIMLQLRTTRGLLPAELTPRFGETLAAAAEGACRDAAAELPAEWWVMEAEEASGGGDSGAEAAPRCRRFALRDPEGLLFSNDAISTVFARLDERLERDDVGGGGLGGCEAGS